MTTRGIVLPLTRQQIITRWLYLAGHKPRADLDPYVRSMSSVAEYRSPESQSCPEIYYLLREHNGGRDPTAPDPADRWSLPGRTFVNRTADCVAAVAWGSGFDRYQPVRGAHVAGYVGEFNCDSMRIEASTAAKCFMRLERPEPGCIVAYGSDPHHHTHGVAVGHTGGVVDVPTTWDPSLPACWSALKVVNIAAYRDRQGNPLPANKMTTGIGWYGKDSWFLRSVMVP